MLDESSVVKLAEGISLYGGDNPTGKHFVFNTLSGDYFSVNAFGYLALSRVNGESTVAEIVEDCAELIPVGRETFMRDVVEFFETCVAQGVLTVG